MAIVSENINLNDGSVFSFKYDDTPITKTGSSAYECAELKNNQYVAYQVESLNKMITATNRSVSGASFNTTETNAFLWDNTSGDWEINYSHFADLSYFGHTALLYEKQIDGGNSTLHLITEIDVSRLVAHISWGKETYTPSSAAQQDPIDYYLVNTNIIQCDIYDVARKNILGSFSIMPVTMNANGNSVYRYIRGNRYGSDESGNGVYSDYSGDFVRNYNNSFRGTIDSSYYYNEGEIYLSLPPDFKINRRDASPINYYSKINNDLSFAFRAGGRAGGGKLMYGYTIFTSENMALTMMALRGLAFYVEDKIYYPIINGGCVVGYTDKIEDSGDYQNYRGIHDHTVPSTRPTPTPGGDGFTPNEYRTNGDVNGLGRFYLMSGTQLDALSDAIKNAPLGFDLRNSLISCYGIPNDGKLVDAPVPSTIKFRLGGVGVEQIEVWDTGVSANRISSSTQGEILGRIQIPRPTETFLDFEPYTTLELYVPFCGWCSLPPSLCVGKEIIVKLYTNVPLCSCRVVVEVGGCAIAHMQGVWGSMVPFTSDGSAIKNAEVTKNVIDVLGSAVVGIAGAATGSEMAIAAGITGAIGSATQAGINSRRNYGYYVGGSGDSTTFNMGNRCWYKLVYPEPDIPSSYGHVVGYICNKTMSITNGMGFTIIDDPRINVNCTDVERDELRELLLKGVIF